MRLRPRTVRGEGAARVSAPLSVAVVGGGLAGLAAATVLAERGAKVTLVERERYLGGRAGAWTERLEDGGTFEMERGFHAFFRQYYNLRALLRRVDPELSLLSPVDDYPIMAPNGDVESFAGLSRTPPWNVVDLTRRTPTLSWRDLLKVNGRAALAMLAFDPDATYERYDGSTAGDYLDSLRFPSRARRMLFDVFAHSFFNPEREMSAAELLMMFHFYFMGNPEGLLFDVARRPFSTAFFSPLAAYLDRLGVDRAMGQSAIRLAPGQPFWVELERGDRIRADAVVLAVTVPALQAIVAASPALGDTAWRARVADLGVTRPFAVWRLWLDRPTDPGRAPFVGTTASGALDNISLYHLFEDESRAWAERTGGAVVELHAYALPEPVDESALRGELLAGLHALYPETRPARILEERFFVRRDCPAFPPGSHGQRPGVVTPVAGVYLAGDFVRLDAPSALMERAVTSGMIAANHILEQRGVEPEPITCIPRRGILGQLGAWV